MTEEIKVINERVDDVPLLIAQCKKLGIPELLDKHFPTHGNRKGLSLGWLASIWLTHIISQSDHRMNQVQIWASHLAETLRKTTSQELVELDFSDDRLEDLLKYFSDTDKWECCEKDLNRKTVRVYDLSEDVIRIDSTTCMSYCQITEDGLFQFGYSKDKRPDLPQLKVNLASLDPLGMPLITAILPGNTADDNLYIPAISEVKRCLKKDQLLFIGDTKMGAIATRKCIQKQKDHYLCPSKQTIKQIFQELQ